MTTNSDDDIDRALAFHFVDVGDTLAGTVLHWCSHPRWNPFSNATELRGHLVILKDGVEPRRISLTLETNMDGAGGCPPMAYAIADARDAAGVDDIEAGGKLTLTCSESEPTLFGPPRPRRFLAEYEPPEHSP